MTFSSHFVFPVLGHTDPAPSETLTNLWSHWLPLEALSTLKSGKLQLCYIELEWVIAVQISIIIESKVMFVLNINTTKLFLSLDKQIHLQEKKNFYD